MPSFLKQLELCTVALPFQVPFTSSSYEGISFLLRLLMMASPVTLTLLPVLSVEPELSSLTVREPAVTVELSVVCMYILRSNAIPIVDSQ